MGFNERITEICGHMKSRRAPIPHGFQNIKESDFKNDATKQAAEDTLEKLEKVVRIGVNKGFDNDAVKKAVKGLTGGIMDLTNEKKMRKDSEIMKVRNNVNASFQDFQAAKISKDENSVMISQINTWLDETIKGIENAKKFEIIKSPHQIVILDSYSKRLNDVKETISGVVDQNSENAYGYFKKMVESIKDIRNTIGTKNMNLTVDEGKFRRLEENAQSWRDDRRNSKPNKAKLDDLKYNPIDTKDPMNYICHAEIAYSAIDSLECDVTDFKETMTNSKAIIAENDGVIAEKAKAQAEVDKIKTDIKADMVNNGLTKEQAKAKYGAILQNAMNKVTTIDKRINSPLTKLRVNRAMMELGAKEQLATVLDDMVANIKDQKTNPYVYVMVGEAIYQQKDKINKFIQPGASAEEMKAGASELIIISNTINDIIKDSIESWTTMTVEAAKATEDIMNGLQDTMDATNKALEGIGASLGTTQTNSADSVFDDMFADGGTIDNKPEEVKNEQEDAEDLSIFM